MFRIGMRVVAISDHKNGAFRKGQIFTIENIKNGCCGNILIMLFGLRHPLGFGTYCPKHGHHGGTWFDSIRFRPVQDQYTSEEIEAVNIDELTEVLNEPVFVEIA